MGFLDKMKNLFTDEIEEPVKSEVIQVEIPSPMKETKVEENIADNDIINNIKAEEKPATPIFFDDDYFKELDQPKQEVKTNPVKEQPKVIKEEKKHFKPTPIISPVYGVLDKNYSKEDITTKQTRVERTNTVVTIDEVRKKAFGTLEDELENTLFSSNSILFNDEIKDNNVEEKEDLFDELIEVDDLENDMDINIVEEELSKTIDKPLNESELFDLIDSMYEKGE